MPGPLDVLDLPKPYQKPSYRVLKDVLERLRVQLPSWSGKNIESSQAEDTKAVSKYLSTIVSNPLAWFSDDADEDVAMERREEIWDEASKRIAERCGRAAMPEMNRVWTIPACEAHAEIQLQIREPPLTGDNLGLKTWGTAFTMAKKLQYLHDSCLRHLFPSDDAGPGQILELGSGTGLVGIAAAAIWQSEVILTDLPEICENLERNAEDNRHVVEERGGSTTCKPLDWRAVPADEIKYQIIIAADSLYDDEHPQMVANMISQLQSYNDTSRCVVAVPLRDEHTVCLAAQLRSSLEAIKFELVVDGQWMCYDDWGAEDEDEEVECWWAVFKRA